MHASEKFMPGLPGTRRGAGSAVPHARRASWRASWCASWCASPGPVTGPVSPQGRRRHHVGHDHHRRPRHDRSSLVSSGSLLPGSPAAHSRSPRPCALRPCGASCAMATQWEQGTATDPLPSPAFTQASSAVESAALAVSGGGATGAWSGALPSLPKGCRSPAARTGAPGRAVAGARDCEKENEGEGWHCQPSGTGSARGPLAQTLGGAWSAPRRGPPVLGLLEPRLLPLKA